MVGIGERISAYFREHSGGMSRKLDNYLSEHMPDLIDTYKLATKSDLADVDNRFNQHEVDLSKMESWKSDTDSKLKHLKTRTERLELKYGVDR